jgi:hypothetical protein
VNGEPRALSPDTRGLKVDQPEQELIRTVADDIQAYLESNPNAADTLEGIVKWWHARVRYEEARQTVKAALDRLIEEGHVRSRQSAHGETIYYRSGRAPEE